MAESPVVTSVNNNSIIKQTAEQKVFSLILLILIISITFLCIFWTWTFWKHRRMRAYKTKLMIRKPKYIILSYIMIFPWILQESIAIIYLYWRGKNEIYLNVQNEPIIYSVSTDLFFHFLFWFGFWSFAQIKVFKLWMMRYNYEVTKEMSNFEWKDHLGLRSVEPSSFFIRYKNIFGNTFLMLCLQIVIIVSIIFIQIFIRLIPWLMQNPSAQKYEQIVILVILTFEFIFIGWIIYGIKALNDHDNFYLKSEIKHESIVTGIAFLCWIFGSIIIYSTNNMDYIWMQCGIGLYAIWLCIFCYFETIWVLKQCNNDHEWVTMQNMYSMPKNNYFYKLSDILRKQEGFEAFMRFLVNEFSCENLLCYVECSQYISLWSLTSRSKAKYKKLIIGYLRICCNEYCIYMPYEIRAIIIDCYMKLYFSNNDDLIHFIDLIHEFPYLEQPQFDDEINHFEYIMQKYIYDSSYLQINISGSLRHETLAFTPGADIEFYVKSVNAIRVELWSLLGDSFTRFRSTNDYKNLVYSVFQ